jgi:hypothetical protein
LAPLLELSRNITILVEGINIFYTEYCFYFIS